MTPCPETQRWFNNGAKAAELWEEQTAWVAWVVDWISFTFPRGAEGINAALHKDILKYPGIFCLNLVGCFLGCEHYPLLGSQYPGVIWRIFWKLGEEHPEEKGAIFLSSWCGNHLPLMFLYHFLICFSLSISSPLHGNNHSTPSQI